MRPGLLGSVCTSTGQAGAICWLAGSGLLLASRAMSCHVYIPYWRWKADGYLKWPPRSNQLLNSPARAALGQLWNNQAWRKRFRAITTEDEASLAVAGAAGALEAAGAGAETLHGLPRKGLLLPQLFSSAVSAVGCYWVAQRAA